MIAIILFNIIILAFFYLYSYKRMYGGIIIGLLFLFIIYAIRDNYGSDYGSYKEIFERFSSMPIDVALSGGEYSYYEVGWRFLCVLFSGLGFHWLVAFCQAITTLSLFYLCKYCVPRRLALFAIFVYLFTPDYMMVQLSMMREGLALSLIIMGVALYLKNQKVIYIIVSPLCAYLFHYTSLVFFVLIIPLLLYRKYLFKFNYVRTIIVLYVLSVFATGVLFSKFDELSTALEMFSKFEGYLDRKDGMSLGLGNLVEFILTGLPVFLAYGSLKEKSHIFLAQVFMLSFILMPMAFRSLIFQRLSLYFSIFSICALPISFAVIREVVIKRLLCTLYILFLLYRFISFFNSPIWGQSYQVYHTILD